MGREPRQLRALSPRSRGGIWELGEGNRTARIPYGENRRLRCLRAPQPVVSGSDAPSCTRKTPRNSENFAAVMGFGRRFYETADWVAERLEFELSVLVC